MNAELEGLISQTMSMEELSGVVYDVALAVCSAVGNVVIPQTIK